MVNDALAGTSSDFSTRFKGQNGLHAPPVVTEEANAILIPAFVEFFGKIPVDFDSDVRLRSFLSSGDLSGTLIMDAFWPSLISIEFSPGADVVIQVRPYLLLALST
jgi:hypothetical protein